MQESLPVGVGLRKSGELIYLAVALVLNSGYYSEYSSIMGTMGLPVMHHTTWEDFVSWIGTQVECLVKWSGEQVRADIEKHGD